MSVFDELAGQSAVVGVLSRAAQAARVGDGSAMSHAWLVTGPPGSGRSNAARCFAAALQCEGAEPGCGECEPCRLVMGGTHPDVEIVNTPGTTIAVDEVRRLIGRAQETPGHGPWRVIIIEDADRMVERTTNILLKAIEEPPPNTVWMLCTPSLQDVLPTIRSRCRHVNLIVPSAQDVADLLVTRDGIDPTVALTAAHIAQGHIGRARVLASNKRLERPDKADAGPESVRERREWLIRRLLDIRGVGDAVVAAEWLIDETSIWAQMDTGSDTGADEAEVRRVMGLGPNDRISPDTLRQFTPNKDELRRRTTRRTRDQIDAALLDLLSLYRDVLVHQVGAEVPLVNVDFHEGIERIADETSSADTIAKMDTITLARERIAANVAPLLVLEAMFIELRPVS